MQCAVTYFINGFYIFSNFDAEMMDAGSEIVENYEPEVSLWVEKYHPRRFTELLSDDVRLFDLYFQI